MKRTFLALGLVLTVLVGTAWALGPYTIQVGDPTPEVTLYIGDSTTSLAETGVTHLTIDHLYYKREGATTSTAISPDELATEDAAWTAGGFIHTNNGLYRLCLPIAAIAAGAAYVTISGDETDMVVFPVTVNLVGYDPSDGVRLGLTALPNAAADAAGGLPISDTGGQDVDAAITYLLALPSAANVVDEWESQSQLDPTGFQVNLMEIGGTAQTSNDNGADINAILADTDEMQGDLTDGGRLDLKFDVIDTHVDAILADTGTTGVLIADDAITLDKFDETTAWPLESADSGATAVARTGADGDDLEDIADQLDRIEHNEFLR